MSERRGPGDPRLNFRVKVLGSSEVPGTSSVASGKQPSQERFTPIAARDKSSSSRTARPATSSEAQQAVPPSQSTGKKGEQTAPKIATGAMDGGNGDGPGKVLPAAVPPDEGDERRQQEFANTPVADNQPKRVRQPWERGRVDDHEAVDDHAPLVLSIEDCGDERPREEKVEVVARASDILTFLGVHPDLVEEIRNASDELEPLGTQVLARKPDIEESKGLEGRGIYYPHVTIGEEESTRDATVYVKGTGSRKNFTGEAVFPGFPAEDDKLFYDDITVKHPRIIGADYIPAGILELINSSIEFAEEAKEKGWTSLHQAIDAGVIIPLAVTHFKEVSEYLKERVDAIRESATDEAERDALDWGDSFAVGTIMQIVPSSERMTKGELNIKDPSHFKNVPDPRNYGNIGSALRKLFDRGFVLYHGSAHAQNAYIHGTAIGDGGDHMFMGDCTGFQQYEYAPNRRTNISPLMHKLGFLYKQFTREELLTPPYSPSMDSKVRITAGQIIAMHEKFWGKMLDGYVDPKAVKALAQSMPLLHTEFTLAASQRLATLNETDRFSEIVSQRDALFAQYAGFSVAEEYHDLLSRNISPRELFNLSNILTREKLSVAPISAYLESGKKTDLLGKDGRIVQIMTLADSILSIPDPDMRDKLLGMAAYYFGKRDLARLIKQPDQIALFEGDATPANLLTVLIEQKRYVSAEKVLSILITSQEEGFRDAYRSDGAPEPSEIYYARQLLISQATPEEIREVYEKCSFDKVLYDFATMTKPLSDEQTQRIRENQTEGNIIFAVENQSLPAPDQLVRVLLGRYIGFDTAEERGSLLEWMHAYKEIQRNLGNRILTEDDKHAIHDILDEMAYEVRETYPELALAHATIMADYYKERDQEQSEKYNQQILDYYTRIMPDRIAEFEAEPALYSSSIEELRKVYRELAEEYGEYGFPVIAGIYHRLAKGKLKAFSW